jgi:hypothetical protein
VPAEVGSKEEVVIEQKHIRFDVKEAKGYLPMA